jgi:murein DD-endopeptidase MepM/ murein hydrolase activator NlpD
MPALVTLAMILALTPSTGLAAERDFMEMDETSESGYNVLSSVSIAAKSALRVGDTGTGSNDFTTINAPYNDPRDSTNTNGVRAHKGTDFKTKDSQGNGRKLFFVYNDGEVYQIQNALNSSGYGRYVMAQHKHVQNSTNYYFQSFYGHLKNSSLTVGGAVTNTSEVGVSGGSGSSKTSYPIHLHLEFRGASATKSNSMKRYPTSFFYSGQGDYGLNTAFVSRTAASSTSVTFRIVSMFGGSERYVPQDKVTLFYKNGNMTSWTSTTMTRSADQKLFTKDLTSLYGTSNTLSYYVKAYTDSYNGSTFYYTFRPYRYTDGTAPTDRPFTVTKTTLAALQQIHSIQLNLMENMQTQSITPSIALTR